MGTWLGVVPAGWKERAYNVPPLSLTPGTRIGPYEVLAFLAEGVNWVEELRAKLGR